MGIKNNIEFKNSGGRDRDISLGFTRLEAVMVQTKISLLLPNAKCSTLKTLLGKGVGLLSIYFSAVTSLWMRTNIA